MARNDERLSYWDGRKLLGIADSAKLYDALHPDQDGLDLIAERFVEGIGAHIGGGDR